MNMFLKQKVDSSIFAFPLSILYSRITNNIHDSTKVLVEERIRKITFNKMVALARYNNIVILGDKLEEYDFQRTN